MSTSEPFPLLSTAVEQLHSSSTENGTARRRRKSSTLLEQLPAGDTGAPGLATSLAHLGVARSHHYVKDPKEGTSKRLSRRRKARSLLRRAKSFATRHTWVIPFVLLFLFGSLYAVNPTSSNPIHAFIFLSYEIPRTPGMAADAPTQYGKGLWDVAFVSFYIVVLSFTREFIMQELLRPLARYAGLRRTKQARFMEQVYSAIYFGILGPAGMWVMSRSPVWYFNTAGMYEGSPHKTLNAEFKFYYLFQAAYWAQQAIVLLLGMEKPRKDFKELVGHHIVSLTMIGLSYRFHFTHIGLAVYITHDISDFFLATSKTLNYIDHWAQGPYFGMFMCIWIYLRHYLNLKIILSLFFEYRTIGPFELNWETEQYKSPLSQVISFVLLSLLQALNIFWLFFILRIAYRFIVDRQAHDDRSEDEASEDEQAEAEVEAEKERRREKERKMLLLNGHANGTAAAAATATSTAMAPPEVLLNGLPVEVNGHANGKNKENDRITRSKGKAQ